MHPDDDQAWPVSLTEYAGEFLITLTSPRLFDRVWFNRAPKFAAAFVLAALRGHDNDFDETCRTGQLDLDSRTRRRAAARRNPGVPDCIHVGEMRHVRDVDLHRQQQGFVAVRLG
jgi:hypothetical protein